MATIATGPSHGAYRRLAIPSTPLEEREKCLCCCTRRALPEGIAALTALQLLGGGGCSSTGTGMGATTKPIVDGVAKGTPAGAPPGWAHSREGTRSGDATGRPLPPWLGSARRREAAAG